MRYLLWVVLAGSLCVAQDWPRFRGPNGTGVSEATGVPAEFGPTKNLLWKTAVPFARSSPVIGGDLVFLTASEGDKLQVIALDRATGRQRWRREIVRTRVTSTLKANDPASSTPATDGKNVYAFFMDFGLVSYAPDGKERWRLPLGPFKTFYGLGTSPVVAGNTVLLVCDTKTKPFLIAVDATTGRVRWRVERNEVHSEGYTTPLVYEGPGQTLQVVVTGARRLDAYAFESGEHLWWLPGLGSWPIPSPVMDKGMVITSTFGTDGPEGPNFDDMLKKLDKNGDGKISAEEAKADPEIGDFFGGLDTNEDGFITREEWDQSQREMIGGDYGLVAVKLGGRGDLSAGGYAWRERKNYPNTATPLIYRGVLYTVKGGGILASLDPVTGKMFKVERVKEALDEHSASPVAADGKVFFTNGAGKVIVLKAAEQWTVLAVNDLGDECFATPAITAGKIYVRTRGSLWAFGAKKP